MKKFHLLVCLTVCAVICFSLIGCGGNSGFRLSYADGMNLSEGYDTDLLYKNNSDFWGGDSGVIYVSKEQSEEYGGYFYQYMSECAGVANVIPSTENGETPPLEHNDKGPAVYTSHIMLTRSKDLNNWEVCGAVDDGMALYVDKNEWLQNALWAPECVYDEASGKYFLYFSARSQKNNDELRALGAVYSDADENDEATKWDRFYLGIAVSDTPVGPFRLVSSENVYGDADAVNKNGKVVTAINPAFMLDKECDELFYTDEFKAASDFKQKDENFAAIDIHPFFDENGDFYVYFVKHVSSGNVEGNTIWGMKMKDMITPDYSTITMLAANSYHRTDIANAVGTAGKTFVRVEYKGSTYNDPAYPRHLSSSYVRYTTYADGSEQENNEISDGAVVEAPQMITSRDKDGKTVYILTYSPRGVGNYQYDVKFAYSYSPLGNFIKPTEKQGATILGVDSSNNFMSNLGHVQFLKVDGQDWLVHWEWPAPFAGKDAGRLYALDSISWQYEESLGFNIPVSNGPTASLQPLPSVYSGYRNVADKAKVSATNVVGDSEKYINDGMAVTMPRNADKELRVKNKTTVTLEFDEPVSIRGLLIYNSYSYASAFKNVSEIEFSLVEKPVWHNGDEKYCFIFDLPFNVEDYAVGIGAIQPGSAAVATFNEIKVNKIKITFDADDKLGSGDELRISEITVLGK